MSRVVAYDPETDVVTIDGLRFAGELFEFLATAAIGKRLEIVKRENSVVTLTELKGEHQ